MGDAFLSWVEVDEPDIRVESGDAEDRIKAVLPAIDIHSDQGFGTVATDAFLYRLRFEFMPSSDAE